MDLDLLPDWHAPLRAGERRVYAAYQRPGVFYAAPLGLDAVGGGSDPAFAIDVYQQDRSEAGLAEFGLLTVRYRASYGLTDLYAQGIAGLPEARFEALPASSGFVQLTAPADFALPSFVTAAHELATADVASPALLLRLDGSALELLLAALRRGLSLLRGTAWITSYGVAARVPGTLSIDLATFSAQAAASGNMELESLRSRIAAEPRALGIDAPIPADAEGGGAFVQAILDRVLGRCAQLTPAPDGQAGTWLRFDSIHGQARWDLSEPIAAPRFFAINADPLGALRDLAGAELEALIVRRHSVPSLRSGWHRLTFCSTVVVPQFGVTEQVVELEAPAAPPERPQTVRTTLPLPAAGGPASISLQLAPREALAYRWSLTSVLESATSIRLVQGPAHQADTEWVTVRPDAAPVRDLPVEASATLLASARLELLARSHVSGAAWEISGTLDEQHPAAVFVFPAEAGDPEITVRALEHATGMISCASMPAVSRLRIDAFGFPGTGRREVQVELTGASDNAAVAIELAPEDALANPQRRGTLMLNRSQPSATWTWVASSPFRSGVCWRYLNSETWSSPSAGPIQITPP